MQVQVWDFRGKRFAEGAFCTEDGRACINIMHDCRTASSLIPEGTQQYTIPARDSKVA